MAGDEASEARDVSQDDFDAEFGLEGNAPNEPAYGGDDGEEGGGSPPTPRLSESETDMSDVDQAIKDRQMFEGMDDNVKLMEARQEAEEAAEEAAETEETEDDPEEPESEDEDEQEEGTEEGTEAEEEEEEAEAEAEEEEAEEEEEGEESEEELSAWGSWLEENVGDTEDRQALFEELLEDDDLVIPYRADGEVHRASPSELVERAAGYAGQGEVTKRAQEVQTRAQELEQRAQEIESTREQLEGFQERLTATVDDPDTFADFLAGRANVEYMEALAENLTETVRTARENPEIFTMRRELGGIKGLLEQMVNGRDGDGAAPGRPGRAEAGAEDAGGDDPIPDDLNFEPGVGYHAPYHRIAHREVRAILRGAGTDDVSFQDVASQWQKEGRKRPITEVATDLLAQHRSDSRKREIALDPPNKGRKPKGKAGGKGKKKGGGSGGGGDGPSPSSSGSWEGIQKEVEQEVRQLQSEGKL